MSQGSTENIDVRVTLRDELSRPAKTAKKSVKDLGDQSEEAAGQLELFEHETGKAGEQLELFAAQNKVAQDELKKTEKQALKTAAALETESHAGGGNAGASGGSRLGSTEASTDELSRIMRRQGSGPGGFGGSVGGSTGSGGRSSRGGGSGSRGGGSSSGGSSRRSGGGGSSRGGNKFTKYLGNFKNLLAPAKILQGIKFGGIADGLSQVISGINALGASSLAVVADIAPLSGNLIAYPSIALAAAQGLGVLKLGFNGLSGAITALSNPTASAADVAAAIKDLGPNARQTALSVAKLLPQLKALRSVAQEGLLAGAPAMIAKVAGVWIPILRGQLASTAKVLNTVGREFVKLFTASYFVKDLSDIFRNNDVLLGHMGHSLVLLVSAFVVLLHTAIPTLDKMSASGDNFANTINNKVLKNQGKLTAFFAESYARFKLFSQAAMNVAGGLAVIFHIASGWSTSMNDGLLKATLKFKDWAKSAKGNSEISKFFAQAKIDIGAIGRLLGGVLKIWGQLGTSNGSNFSKDLDYITTNILPLLGNLLGKAQGQFIPQILNLVAALGKFATLVPIISPFSVILKVAADALTYLDNALAKSDPWVKKLVGWTVTLLLFTKTAALFKVLKPISGLLMSFGKVLGTFLLDNPFGWIIIGVGLLVLMYFKVKWFHDFVNRAFADIKQWALDVWHDGILPAFHGMIDAFNWVVNAWKVSVAAIEKWALWLWHNVFDRIWHGIMDTIHWFANNWKMIVKVGLIAVFGLLGVALDILWTHWNAIWGFVSKTAITVWHWLDSEVFQPLIRFFSFAVPLAVHIFSTIITTEFNIVRAIVTGVWNFLYNDVFLPMLHFFQTVIPPVVSYVASIFTTTFNIIKSVVIGAWDWLYSNVFSPMGSFFGNVIISNLKLVGSTFTTAFNTIKSVIADAWKLIGPTLNSIKNLLGDIVNPLETVVKDAGKLPGLAGKGLSAAGKFVFGGAVGGSMQMGQRKLVGEIGPEQFISKLTGKARMLGMYGPEIVTFREPGQLLPYGTDGGNWPVTAPNWARAALAAKQRLEPVGVAPRVVPDGELGDTDVFQQLPEIRQYIYPQSAFDFRRQMKTALRAAQRDAKERGAK